MFRVWILSTLPYVQAASLQDKVKLSYLSDRITKHAMYWLEFQYVLRILTYQNYGNLRYKKQYIYTTTTTLLVNQKDSS